MKKTVILLNTARGGFINESDLKFSLENKIISAAGLDTLTIEPPMQNHPLFSVPNCIITPHNAWAPVETRARMMDIIYNNIHSFLQGNGGNLLTF
jgi:glycerate dehydrogenase